MKKKGFTLIELLAVIVVLAIIALIATPIVMNVIKNAQKGAVERSAERYVDAVEQEIATYGLENELVKDGIYTVNAEGNLVLGEKTLTVEVSGDRPTAGSKVAIENGQVVSVGTSMTIGDYIVTINDKGSAVATAKGDVVALCTAIAPSVQEIYDDSTGEIFETIAGVQATESAPYALGAVYSCDLGDGARTFYVLKEDGDNIKLIMDENLGYSAWAESGDYSEDPVTANAYLISQTSGWTTLASVGGTVELPSGQDLADAIGDTEWNEIESSVTYGPAWLQTNLYVNNGPLGYWTSTVRPDPDYNYGEIAAWYFAYDGTLSLRMITESSVVGVRPVITISKSSLSV